MAKNRSQRLRKKLYCDEFTVYGFKVASILDFNKPSDSDVFLDDFIDVVEARNLVIFGNACNFFVMANGRYDSPTEDDRAAIKRWYTDNPKCISIEVGELIAVHGDW